NISQVSTAMDINEGQFSTIGDDFNIKVEKKSGENGQFLDDVIIHKKSPENPNKNTTVIIAEKGELVSQLGSNTLSLVLMDGNYYDDIQPTSSSKRNNMPFVKSYFDEYTLNIDISKLNDVDIDQENEFNDQNMFTSSELRQEIDSLANRFSYDIKNFAEEAYFRTGIRQLYPRKEATNNDNPEIILSSRQELLDRFTSKRQDEVITLALNNVTGTQQAIT